MKRSKKIFLLLAALFFIMLIAIGFDISRRTTFPGTKKPQEESIVPNEHDTTKINIEQDSLKIE